jgi:hypothetical protein
MQADPGNELPGSNRSRVRLTGNSHRDILTDEKSFAQRVRLRLPPSRRATYSAPTRISPGGSGFGLDAKPLDVEVVVIADVRGAEAKLFSGVAVLPVRAGFVALLPDQD